MAEVAANQNNQANTPGTGQPAASNQPWYSEQHKEYVTTKGWKGPGEVLESYVNLEKLMGADKAGRTVVLPKDANDAEGIKAYRSKIGVPESADKYELEVPQDSTDDFAKVASQWFLDAGVPKEAAQALSKNWNAYMAQQMEAYDQQLQVKSTEELNALKLEWGGEFDKRAAVAKDFLRASGWTDEDVAEYEKARGTTKMLKDFYTWGSKVQEAGFAGDPKPPSSSGTFNISKEVAKAKHDEIRTLRMEGKISDKDWAGGKRAEFEKYAEIMHGAA